MRIGKLGVKGDKGIWLAFVGLLAVSVVSVFTSVGRTAYQINGIGWMIGKELLLVGSAWVVCWMTHWVNYRKYGKLALGLMCGGVLLLVWAMVQGRVMGGERAAHRWLDLPVIGQIQPSEIVKYFALMFEGWILVKYKETRKSKEVFWKLFIPMVVIGGLILVENVSSAGLFFMVYIAMLIIGGVNMKYLSLGIVGLVLGALLFNYVSKEMGFGRGATASSRVEQFINNDYSDITRQENLALMAISTGGLTGKWVGRTEIARFLSESHNDFIFAIMLEEGGIFICLGVMFLYLFLFYRVLLVAKNARGYFGKYLAIGIGLMFMVQASINMAVAVNIFPVTGQTLPFISYGGTSLWISSFALGIVLNISRKENQKNKREKLLTTTGETIETEEDFMDEEEQTTSHDNKDSVRRKFEQRINETIEDESNN